MLDVVICNVSFVTVYQRLWTGGGADWPLSAAAVVGGPSAALALARTQARREQLMASGVLPMRTLRMPWFWLSAAAVITCRVVSVRFTAVPEVAPRSASGDAGLDSRRTCRNRPGRTVARALVAELTVSASFP